METRNIEFEKCLCTWDNEAKRKFFMFNKPNKPTYHDRDQNNTFIAVQSLIYMMHTGASLIVQKIVVTK